MSTATQTLTQVKRGARGVPRTAYHTIPRHPVRVVALNDKGPNYAGLIRTCEAFVIEHLSFSTTPHPMKASVKTERWQPVTFRADVFEEIERARADGYTIVALEQTTCSALIHETALPERMCLVVGHEGHGIPANVLALCERAVEIPQFGFVRSLNVVTAAAICLYEYARQHGMEAPR